MNKINILKIAFCLGAILQIAFIVLKLCKVVNWPWWLVFRPLYVDIGVYLISICIVIGIIIHKYKN